MAYQSVPGGCKKYRHSDVEENQLCYLVAFVYLVSVGTIVVEQYSDVPPVVWVNDSCIDYKTFEGKAAS